MPTLPNDAPAPKVLPPDEGQDASDRDTAYGADTESRPQADRGIATQIAQTDIGTTSESPSLDSFGCPPEIPNYKIRAILGQGGMGIVYRADQTQLSRPVAIKMLSTPGKPSAEQLARFHAEAAALARLQHPNIIEIYDYGECNGRPYFVMELVAGRSLADQAAGKPQAPILAAHVMMVVARAVQAFHEKGILHRDLKPGNVLLQVLSGDDSNRSIDRTISASFSGVTFIPKITDFGVAKDLLADQKITRTGTTVGTPQYMAPEQAESEHQAIGPATDVYGMGATLYELLTGLPPIRGTTPLEVLVQIPTHVPAPPSFLQPGIPRDLDIICGKCLEKLPTRRYLSAQALADDLQAYLEGRPIKARPAGTFTKTVRWCRRRPLVAAFAGLSVLLSLVLIFSMLVYNNQLGIALNGSQRRLVELYTLSGMHDVEEGLVLSGMVWFAEALKHDLDRPGAERKHRIRLGTTSRQAPELRELWGGTKRVSAAAVEPGGKWVAIAEETGTVRCFDLQTGRGIYQDSAFDRPLSHLAISEDGKWVAGIDSSGTAHLWQPGSRTVPARSLEQKKPFDRVSFQAGGNLLILHQVDEVLKLWDLAKSNWLMIPAWPSSPVESAVISPDGSHAVTVVKRQGRATTGAVSWTYVAQVWEIEKGPAGAREIPLAGEVIRVALNRGGKQFAVLAGFHDSGEAKDQTKAWIVNVQTGITIKSILPHPRAILNFVFDPTGARLLTSCADHRGRFWDTATGDLLGVALLHRSDNVKVAFSTDGRLLATGAGDNQARVWSLPLEQALTPPLPHQDTVGYVAFGLNNTCLITADEFTARIWRIPEPKAPEKVSIPAPSGNVKEVLSRDDKFRLVIDGATAQVFDAVTHKAIGMPLSHGSAIIYAVFSPAGDRVATTSDDNTARIWKTATGEMLTAPLGHDGDVLFAAFSPDGSELITTSQDRTARLWDVKTGEPLSPSWLHDESVVAAAFRSDPEQVITRERSGRTFAWDISPDSRPFEMIELSAQVMAGARFVKDHGLVPIGAEGLARAWNQFKKYERSKHLPD